MNWKRHFVEAATLVIVSVLCATIANLIAGRERKLAFVGDYPNALVVPSSARANPVPAPVPATPSAGGENTTASATETSVATATNPQPGTQAATLPEPAQRTQETQSVPQASSNQSGGAAAPPVSAAPAASRKATLDELIARFPPHDAVPSVEIHPADADWLFDQGVLFLDARRTKVYEEGHIAGARSFPVWESDVDDRVAALVQEGIDPRTPVVIYCSGGDCEDSHMLAQKLWGMTLNNALVYKDGYPDWVKRGRPVRTGSAP